MGKSIKKMSKRDFIKCGIFGLGASAFLAKGKYLFALAEDGMPEAPAADLWKWSKESPYYMVTPHGTKCLLCPNGCVLKENQTGVCRSRINYKGKIFSLVYGNPCAVHVDPIEKKPLFHFLPESRAYSIATAGCNMSCLNCQNWSISQASPKQTDNYDMMPARVVEESIRNACKTIAYTYTEPTIFYEYMYDTARLAREKGVKNIIKSNGYINEKPLRNLCKFLDAANIDLKSFDNSVYHKLNGGLLQPVLNTLKIIHEEHVWLEITYLLVPGWTDNFTSIKAMCQWLVKNGLENCPLHIDRFMPEYKLTQVPPTPVSSLEKARKIALEAGIKFVYVGNLPGTSFEDTLCPHCGKVLVERRGFAVLKKHIVNHKCLYCGTVIPGIWN